MSNAKKIPLWVWTLAAMAAAGLAAFAPALAAGYIWDDEALTKNPAVLQWKGLLWIWFNPSLYANYEEHYWPLVYTTFWIEHKLWGVHPAGFHLVNILLHVANSALVWRLLLRMRAPGALLVGFLFLLHPARVESVAWVIQRKDVLSTLLYLLAFHACLAFEAHGGRRNFVLSAGCLALALLCKSIVVTMPVAAALWFMMRPGGWSRRAVVITVALSGFALAMGVLDYLYLKRHPSDPSGLEFLARLGIVARAPWFYGFKSFWPTGLMAIYPRWDAKSHAAWFFIAATLLAACGLVLLFLRGWRKTLGALLFYGATLAPATGILDFDFMGYSFVADRFQYLAGGGLLALLGAGLAPIFTDDHFARGKLGKTIIVLLAAAWGLATFQQASLYHDQKTLFEDALRKNPGARVASGVIGFALLNSDNPAEAIPVLEKLIEDQPNNIMAMSNLGLAYEKTGDFGRAEQMFRRAIGLDAGFAEALVNLAALLHGRGRRPEAEHYLSLAAKAAPNDWRHHYIRAHMRLEEGGVEEARRLILRAVELAPREAGVHLVLATIQLQSGQLNEAADSARRATELSPDVPEAHQTLGLVLGMLGRKEEARKELETALRLNPKLVPAREALTALNSGRP